MWFIPLANKLIQHQNSAGRPIVVGINGCQGSGKSTLSALLITFLNDIFNVPTIGFSIDDFYLSKQSRNSLSKTINPLLATRGVPGTHDISLLETVLKTLVEGKPANIPVFDKSTDDLKPVNEWINITQANKIIILEGWCVGLDSQHPSELTEHVNELEAIEDVSCEWRQYVNDVLSVDYKRVFSSIDYLIMFQAPSFDHVYAWRCEQEHKLIASIKSRSILKAGVAQSKPATVDSDISNTMNDQEILRFVQFYQRLTQHALTSMPAKCDSLFILDANRSIEQCR
ncbi:MAG: D-glycerate 3-kinase [Alphaproteobacteria bacterium]|jgi:D-glycerate 3-kinase